MTRTMKPIPAKPEMHYLNLLQDLNFLPDKPQIEGLAEYGDLQLKKVSLKGGIELKCHQNDCQVIVIWLRGKAKFFANGQEYTMQPGTLLEMPPQTPHGAMAETDCVFAVLKVQLP